MDNLYTSRLLRVLVDILEQKVVLVSNDSFTINVAVKQHQNAQHDGMECSVLSQAPSFLAAITLSGDVPTLHLINSVCNRSIDVSTGSRHFYLVTRYWREFQLAFCLSDMFAMDALMSTRSMYGNILTMYSTAVT